MPVKALLLLGLLMSAPSAFAMDYVKCEAIQKAFVRVNADLESYKKSIKTAYREKATTEICGPGTAAQATRFDCAWGHGLDAILARWNELQDADPTLKSKELRAQKVQADYNKAECY